MLARAIALRLENKYGKTVIVENRPGAGGNIGAQAVAQPNRTAIRSYWVRSASTQPIRFIAN